jgi:membrane-bound lytic murein transglycosylase B
MAVCLLASCSTPETSDSEPRHAASTSPAPSARTVSPPRSARPPAVPANNAVALARQLNHAAATLRTREAEMAEGRSAGELQQLAIRALATAPAGFRRRVTSRLHPETARAVASMLKAAWSLQSLSSQTEPQQEFPRWRIVAPPPAAELLAYYKQAQRRSGVPWTYLAAIHLVETRMGRIRGVSTAGARGPMQFLPTTWDLYGAGGDITEPRDAIHAAARLLKANGAPGDMADALWHYNPSESYVDAVMQYALTMQRSTSAYHGYWHWRVFYRHSRGTYVLPLGYPKKRPVPLRGG